MTGATLFGVWAGNKRSQRSLENAVFNNGARTYYRTKQIWVCKDPACIAKAKGEMTPAAAGVVAIAIVGLTVLAFAFGGNDTSKQDPEGAGTPVPVQAKTDSGSRHSELIIPDHSAEELAAGMAAEAEDERALADYGRSLAAGDPRPSEATMPAHALAAVESEFRRAHPDARVALQAALQQNGLYSGRLDGAWGQGTASAFRSAIEQLTASGETLDFETVPGIHATFDRIRYGTAGSILNAGASDLGE
ncbi:hypothetical protein LAZ40_09920 [Cereibacter sphaeroides]|uniref:hypothetical protein n=1 Tax=Cereibacter sphaeroides TaxID=1063 RepID=UPI001F3C8DD5|nr:hypothetical protein [Cereibacter sphaeroides]MCE6959368.1 hypothetical protein [Cereibacter sphaeroides]MCE6972960.1 hypothetical protein [Cereibacter sphaeroides]